MKQATRLLQLAVLNAIASGTLQTECDVLAGGKRSLFSEPLSAQPPSRYKTFCGPTPPLLETWQVREPCDDGLLFVAPAAAEGLPMVESEADIEGPAILSTSGDLVWTQSGWGRTSDLKVQTVGDRSYITFWRDESNRREGGGSYVVLDQSYEMVKELRAVGEISEKPIELRLTDKGTAIMVMHNITQTKKPFGGLESGWIKEALIQEVDVKSNTLASEWRASEHFDPAMSQLDSTNQGRGPETAFDFFHATGVELDHDDNYIISSRNMCNAAALRRSDGSVMWVLGGSLNSFGDSGAGQAIAMVSSEAIQWYGDSTLLLLDSGHAQTSEGQASQQSNARLLDLNTTSNKAALLRTYTTPVGQASQHAQGTVQRLRSGHVFVGWGDDSPLAVVYTEYSRDGRALCAARFQQSPAPSAEAGTTTARARGGRVVSKHAWTGTPVSEPVMVVRPQESALYVSWNGDTRTTSWVLRSNNTERRDGSLGLCSAVDRTGFETRIPIPRGVGEVIEVIGVDANGRTLVSSELIWSEGASGTWSTQRVTPPEGSSPAQNPLSIPVEDGSGASWKQYTTSGEKRCQLLLALSGLGLSLAAFLWCRWIGRRWWRPLLREGALRCRQRETVVKGEKGMV